LARLGDGAPDRTDHRADRGGLPGAPGGLRGDGHAQPLGWSLPCVAGTPGGGGRPLRGGARKQGPGRCKGSETHRGPGRSGQGSAQAGGGRPCLPPAAGTHFFGRVTPYDGSPVPAWAGEVVLRTSARGGADRASGGAAPQMGSGMRGTRYEYGVPLPSATLCRATRPVAHVPCSVVAELSSTCTGPTHHVAGHERRVDRDPVRRDRKST